MRHDRGCPVHGDSRIEVHPATAHRWSGVATVLATADRCWCQYWRLSSGEYSSSGAEARRERLREQTQRRPAPGVVAYLDGEAAGWCGFGPRADLERLVRSRTIPAVDDRPVWAIVCFLVRTAYRRRGIARALLAGVIAYARREGAVALEAYPVDPGSRRIHSTAAYVGTTAMSEAAGFQRILETDARSDRLPRSLMPLDLSEGPHGAHAAPPRG